MYMKPFELMLELHRVMPLARQGRVEISHGIFVVSRDLHAFDTVSNLVSDSEFYLVFDDRNIGPIGFNDIQELKREILKFNLNLNQEKLREFLQDISV